MKKQMNVVTGILNIAVVISMFILPAWDYASMGLSIYTLDYGKITTFELLGKSMYNQGVLQLCVILSMLILLATSIMNFKKVKMNFTKVAQGIASVVLVLMYFLVHIGVFSFLSDYSVCELNILGIATIVLCLVNSVLSFFVFKVDLLKND